MAKFKDLSLDLETGEHIDFDDADLIKMGYDGAELYINSTISGVRAAQPYQMVRYDQLTEVSGILDDKFVWRDGSKKLTGDWITGSGIEVPWLQFELENPVPPHSEGLLHWNSDDGTLDLDMPGGEVHLQIGQEQLVRVLNKSGVQIDNGSVVYISGAQGDRPTVELAQANSIITTGAIGMATEDIADDALGYVTTAGTVRDLDTSGITAGSLIYLSGDTAGAFTDVRPVSPDYKVLLGYVTREHANVGTVIIKPIITPRLMSLSDVLRETPTQDGEFLAWNTANSRFELTTQSGAGDIDHGDLLGLDDDDHLQYILVDGTRGFTGTVSGVDPTESYHLTTKFYVDDLVSTTSGNIVDQIITDHGELIGLSDDDHLQYVPRNGSRGFTSTVSGVAATQPEHLVIYEQLTEVSGTIPHTLLDLTDTPTDYTGYAGSHVMVNEYEDGVIFVPSPPGTIVSGTTPPASDDLLWYNGNDNNIYYYDLSRGKWLTVFTHNYLFTYSGNIDGLYMSVGNVVNSYAHFNILRNATITAITAVQDPFGSAEDVKGYEIQATGVSVFNFNMVLHEYVNESMNVDINANDHLQMYVVAAGARVRDPIVTLELKWRYSV